MKVAFSIKSDEGINSPIFDHFGEAPHYLILDGASGEWQIQDNQDLDHESGHCDPMKAIDNQKVDLIVTGSIGGGALKKANSEGIRVLGSVSETVSGNIQELNGKGLPEFVAEGEEGKGGGCCGNHGCC
ncbi:MAG: NifB/NifX family molybdenum-iron cluster-binding protein [Planctomycetes bacterium]|nr:NifB/NifX family molybdenum-iron cluster-binding protein [Planctomycetota bacterium]